MKFGAIFLSATLGTLVCGERWAQFCDDEDCSVNCGIAVDVQNEGCLAGESNRRSVWFHGATSARHFISFSPSGNCECEESCLQAADDAYIEQPCLKLGDGNPAQSYSFKEGDCPSDHTSNC
ncbi:hypothetical protein GGR53DRAFT_466514 [Hypoxylon sp. FL1150]|nr:hypothetical protein GGR53DRAFT_466514 [Hypoxylon sp. FL1150]